jgi:sialic acid synthase SpsE
LLISEIGNNHFGSFTRAKELIKASHESGADLIKGQAFKAQDIRGSMPKSFYEECAFSLDQYLELIYYARSLGNDLFYSIFSKGFEKLRFVQNWHKIEGSQTRSGKATINQDIDNMIISVPADVDFSSIYKFKNAEILYVSEYMTKEPELDQIEILSKVLGRTIGYSDHTLGIKWPLKAIQIYNVNIIEKHFCLRNHESYGNKMFRDTVHAVTPKYFEKLAVAMSN